MSPPSSSTSRPARPPSVLSDSASASATSQIPTPPPSSTLQSNPTAAGVKSFDAKERPEPSRPWSEEELKRLEALVAKDGPGSWAAKAVELGTGRSAASTGSAWRRQEAMRRAAANGGAAGPLTSRPIAAATSGPVASPCEDGPSGVGALEGQSF